MKETGQPAAAGTAIHTAYRVIRRYAGEASAEALVLRLIKAHAQAE